MKTVFASALLVLTSPCLMAVPLTNSVGIAGPTTTINFSELNPTLPVATSITNQFGGLGATFSGGLFFSSGNAPGSLDGLNGFSGDYLFNATTTATIPAGPVVSHTVQFGGAVTDASINVAFSAPLPAESTLVTFTSFLGVTAVETFNVADPDLNNFSNNFYGFTSSLFDRIVVTTNYTGAPASRPGVAYDNLAFRSPPAGAPEIDAGSAWLPLILSAGFLMVTASRRRSPRGA